MTSNSPKPKIMVQNISCILPQQSRLGGLFLGNVYGAQNAAILKEYGIRAVLTTSIQTDIEYSIRDVPFHMRILAHDKEDYNMKQHINECIQFIEQSRQLTNVYVHCFAGVSRSAAIVCAYIMWKLKWNFQTTMAFVRAKRVVAKPNQGFMKQLMELDVMLQGNEEGFDGNYGHFVEDKSLQSVHNLPPKNEIITPQEEPLRKSSKPTVTNGINTASQTYPASKPNKMTASTQYSQRSPTQHSLQNKTQSQSQYYVPVPPKDTKAHTDDMFYVQPEKVKTKTSVEKKDSVKTATTTTTTTDNKFAYLQNFFPQSNSVKNQNEKEKSRISSMSTGGVDTIMGVSKLQSARNSLKGMENGNLIPENPSQKHTANYHVPLKPSQSSLANNHLILGGRKPQQPQQSPNNNHHNSIPIPNVKQRSTSSSVNKTYFIKNDPPKSNNNKPNQQLPYHPLKSGYINRASMDSSDEINRLKVDQNVGRNQINVAKSPRGQQASSYLRYDKYTGMKSPTASGNNSSHFSGENFNMTRSVPASQGFFATKLSVQKNETKTTSRLVKPKDLPGYKNY